MKSMVKSMAALAASVVIATASLTGVASAAVQPFSSNTLVKNSSGIWVAEGGYIKTDKVNTYSETFILDYGDITIGQSPDDDGLQRSKYTANFGYEDNYKWTCVILNGTKGKTSAYTPEKDRYEKTVTAIANDVGVIYTGDYYCYLHAGSHSGTDYLERCRITVK